MGYFDLSKSVGDLPHLTSDAFRDARQKLGVSQSELGVLLGMSRFTISKMERGLYPISRRVDFSMSWLVDIWKKNIIKSLHISDEADPVVAVPVVRERQVLVANHKQGKKKKKRRR